MKRMTPTQCQRIQLALAQATEIESIYRKTEEIRMIWQEIKNTDGSEDDTLQGLIQLSHRADEAIINYLDELKFIKEYCEQKTRIKYD